MRYAVLLLMFTTPLAASWWPAWSETNIQMNVGDKVFVRVTPTWSGLVNYGNGVHWQFASDNPAVATGSVQLESTAPKDFTIVGIGPGVAQIRDHFAPYWPYVTIRVACAPETPAVAAVPVMRADLGREVRLQVVTQYPTRSTFCWYLGQIGDTSHPLGDSSAEVTYTPDSFGSQYIWAEAATTCFTSQVQFRVDVYPRRRSVSH